MDIKMNNQGVSEVVSSLLVIMIVFGAIAIVLAWGLPYIEEKKMSSQLQTSLSNFDVMDDTIRNLIIDGPDARSGSQIVSTNDKGSLSIDSSGTKFILMYSFNESYDFNVSGLDDEDENFTVTMGSGSPTADSAKIYWLDPSMSTWSFSPGITPYQKIFEDQWCVQSFNNSYGWNLTKIQVYIRTHGIITSNLVVSIYDFLDFDDPLASVSLPASSIPNSWGWLERDFEEDIPLIKDDTYYIVVSTSGGDDSSNYYMWYCGSDIYSNGMAFNATDVLITPLPDNDFPYNTFYSENQPPSTPKVTTSYYMYSGLACYFTVNATDPDDDHVKYRVMWGDGVLDDWTINYSSGTEVAFLHLFKKPGTYTITVQAKDIYGNVNEEDHTCDVTIRPWEYFPEDATKWLGNSQVDEYGNINATDPLNETLRIDLINWTCDVYENQSNRYPGTSGTPFGRIWVFDLGSVTYTAPYSIGTLKTLFENGATLSIDSSSSNWKKNPSFFEEDEALALRIIQVRGTGSVGGGGVGTYELGVNMKNSLSREPRFPTVYNLKLQIYGENEILWLNYFQDKYNFTMQPDGHTLIYENDGKTLIFDNSLVEINLEAIR